jgi:hypothetical protein
MDRAHGFYWRHAPPPPLGGVQVAAAEAARRRAQQLRLARKNTIDRLMALLKRVRVSKEMRRWVRGTPGLGVLKVG